MKVTLRKFNVNDIPFIISRLSWRASNEKEAVQFINDLDKDDTLNVYCVLCDEQPSGYIALNEKEDGSLVYGIHLIEEMRGKGVACKAYPILEKMMYKKGYRKVKSSCAQENVASARMHKKLGFTCVKEELSPKGTPMFRWEKEIKK